MVKRFIVSIRQFRLITLL